MKKILVILTVVCLAFCSCAGEGQPQSTSENYGGYKVQKLFTVDSCTVYRFYDDGRYHYFVNRKNTNTETEYTTGKTTRTETIDTM